MGARRKDDPAPPAGLSELARLFLRLGFTAFGGPAAHIAMMENEIVRRRQWLSPERFLDLLGASNLIPGPSSTELAIFIGYERAGWRGLLVGGTCFILPAAGMVALLGFVYVRLGALPQVAGVLYGVKPVVIAVVVQALWKLGPKAVKKSVGLAALAVAAGLVSALRVDAFSVLIGAGVTSALTNCLRKRAAPALSPSILGLLSASGASAAAPFSMPLLFVTFLKIGASAFGSGYVLLAFLRADLVDRLHWLTEPQLLDAVAIGQVTPGPVFTTATFIGYLLGGSLGAVVATVGIFLPGFVLVALMPPLIVRIRSSPVAGAFLDGVTVAALALMAVVTVQLGRAALVDVPTVVLALAGVVALVRFEVNTTWLVVGGAVVGAALRAAR